MKHAPLLANLLPPVSYDSTAPNIQAHLKAEGNTHDRVLAFLDGVYKAWHPATSGEYISKWEEELGLLGMGITYQERVAQVLAKLNETGGLSILYFKNIAAKAGYEIEIVEPSAFEAGISRCGDRLYIEDVMWVWHVIVQGQTQTIWHFRAGMSLSGEPLSTYSDTFIESLFIKLKPAHTLCVFFYGEYDG
ncbi:YmfQ family protein [Neisseria sp. Ec49-e6-T10]|uniref:YmfQ family protein n=1 Tax=Neisseria sp. Ec49-e6-T10 TaxID=3140744 RepID=UPI003EC0A84B